MKTIYECLQKDHRGVLALLDKLIASEKAESEETKALVQQIRDELIPHSRAEEAILYNCLRSFDESKNLVHHSYGEHMAVETMLRSLQVTEAVHVNWQAGAQKMRDMLQHHIDEEEGQLFTQAKQLFTLEEARAMGAAFEKLKPEIREKTILGTTWDMVVNMMPMRLQETLRKTDPNPLSKAS